MWMSTRIKIITLYLTCYFMLQWNEVSGIKKESTRYDISFDNIVYGDNMIKVSCFTSMLYTSSVMSVPPRQMQIIVGNKSTEVFYQITFDTNSVSQYVCSSTFRIIAFDKNGTYDKNETDSASKRYVGTCVYNGLDIRSPNRIISVLIQPIKDMDFFTWQCKGYLRDQIISAEVLEMPVSPVWSLPPSKRQPYVSVIPREADESMKVGCFMDGYVNEKTTRLRPKGEHYLRTLPQLKLSMYQVYQNSYFGLSSRDIYGRFSHLTYDYPAYSQPRYNCTVEEINRPLIHCLAYEISEMSPNMGFTSECLNLALIISEGTYNRYGRNLMDVRSLWVTSNLLQNHDESHVMNDTNPFILKDFDYARIIVELPGDKNFLPLRIHSENTPISFIYKKQEMNFDIYRTHVMPDSGITGYFYSLFIESIIDYPIVKGLRVQPYHDEYGHISAELSCSGQKSRIIFIYSGVCVIKGGTYVKTAMSANERGNWCDEYGGQYKVEARDLDKGESLFVTQQVIKPGTNHSYITGALKCLYRQYYCFFGERSIPLESITLLEPDESELGLKSRPWYGKDIKNFMGGSLSRFEVIHPYDCPQMYYESMDHLMVKPVDTEFERKLIRYRVQKFNTFFINKRSQEKSVTAQLSHLCPCRQIINLCQVPNSPGLMGYAVIDFTETSLESEFFCDAMGHQSEKKTFMKLLTDYVCRREISWNDVTLHLVSKYLPKPRMIIDRKTIKLSDGRDFVKVSCINIKEQCVENMINNDSISNHTGAVMRFFGQSLFFIEKIFNPPNHVTSFSSKNKSINLSHPVGDNNILLVEKKSSQFQEGDWPFEYLVEKQFLHKYDGATCSYINEKLPSSESVPTRQYQVKHLCTEAYYTPTITVVTSKNNNSISIMCTVSKDSPMCPKPQIILTIHSKMESGEASIICDSSATRYNNVRVGSHSYQYRNAGLNEMRFSEMLRGRAYCIKEPSKGQNRAVILVDRALQIEPLNLQCTYKVPRINIHTSLFATYPNVTREGDCVYPPPALVPIAKIINETISNSSSLVGCFYPHWFPYQTCEGEKNKQMAFSLHAEISSSRKLKAQHTIALFDSTGKCSIRLNHKCLDIEHYKGAMAVIEINDTIFSGISNDDGATVKIYCASQKKNSEYEHHVVLLNGLDRMGRRVTASAETSTKPSIRQEFITQVDYEKIMKSIIITGFIFILSVIMYVAILYLKVKGYRG